MTQVQYKSTEGFEKGIFLLS